LWGGHVFVVIVFAKYTIRRVERIGSDMHKNCELLFRKYAAQIFTPGKKVLEIGPDAHPSGLRRMVSDQSVEWDTLDIATGITDQLTYVTQDEYKFPIPDATYDIVISANVLEHVKKIWRWLPEVARVCKAGGHVITIVPVSWPYHPFPVDCWRVFPDGMAALYEDSGITPDVMVCESLETKLTGSRRQVPGPTYVRSNVFKRAVKRVLGWPVDYALDTIGIGTKKYH
jgi:SAM-dependent methyltransferase